MNSPVKNTKPCSKKATSLPPSSNSTTTTRKRSTPQAKIDAITFKQLHDPAFGALVNYIANLKVRAAIQTGHLRPGNLSNEQMPKVQIWSPRVDIVDDASTSTIFALFELPGIKADNLKLVREPGPRLVLRGKRTRPSIGELKRMLNISDGERQDAEDSEMLDGTVLHPHAVKPELHQELRYGWFFRALTIPDGITDSDIKAIFIDGVLTVSWPYVEKPHVTIARKCPPVDPSTVKPIPIHVPLDDSRSITPAEVAPTSRSPTPPMTPPHNSRRSTPSTSAN